LRLYLLGSADMYKVGGSEFSGRALKVDKVRPPRSRESGNY
ncbi:unnamed protein product, partial [marine sediment metagenome]